MKRIIHILPLLFVLAACETVIDYDGDLAEPMLVAHPLGGPISTENDTTLIHIGHSVSILDNSWPDDITNASVRLRQEGGNWQTLSHFGEGVYGTSTLALENGKTYELSASAPGYDPITSKASIPSVIPIEQFDFLRYVPEDTVTGTEGYSEFRISWTDPGDDQYYRLMVLSIDNTPPMTEERAWRISTDSPLFPALDAGDEDGFLFIYEIYNSNELFAGRKITFDLKVYSPSNMGWSFVASLDHLDEHAYKYMNSYQRYVLFGGDGDPFAQPVQVYNNIEGGLGFFGGTATSLRPQ